MKVLVIIFLVSISLNSFAKRDVDLKSFNKKMNTNITNVISDNPQMYETKPASIKRSPASTYPANPSMDPEDSTEKLDEVQEQANTYTSW